MSDCAHWLPIISNQLELELREEKTAHQRESKATQNAVNEIRSIINTVEDRLTPSIGLTNEQIWEMEQQALSATMGADMRPYQSIFDSLFGKYL